MKNLRTKLLAEFYCSFFYREIPILNANIRAFNLEAESLKLSSSGVAARPCICTLFLPGQWTHLTKLIQLFLFHLLICARSTSTLLQLTGV